MGNKESSLQYETRGKGDVVANPLAEQERADVNNGMGSSFATKASSQAILAAAQTANHEAPSADDSLAGARRVYIQRGPNGFGFLFSTNSSGGLGQTQGMNHFISRVDEGSPADQSGLTLGDRILKVNDVSITNMIHRNVVRIIQESPESAPLRLLVCAPARVTANTLRINGAVDGVSVVSDDVSLRSHQANGRTNSSSSSAPHPDHLRTVLIVIRNPSNGLLLAVRLNHGRGWWLPAGPALSAESVEDAAHRHTLTKTGLAIKIIGLLRIEQDVARGKLRIVLLAQPRANSVDVHEDAQWMTLPQLQELHARGRPPWPSGTLGLGGTELLDWGRYLANQGVVCPLYVLADRGDPVWTPGSVDRNGADPSINLLTGGSAAGAAASAPASHKQVTADQPTGAAQQRTQQPTQQKPQQPQQPQQSQQQQHQQQQQRSTAAPQLKLSFNADTDVDASSDPAPGVRINGAAEHESTDDQPSPSPTSTARSFVTTNGSAAAPAAAAAAAAATTTTTNTAANTIGVVASSAVESEASGTRRIRFAETQPEAFETFNKEDYERALDPGEGLSHLSELFQKNNVEMAQEQEQEVKDSVQGLRLRGFYIERLSADDFGIEITHIPRGGPESPDLVFSEVVTIKSITPGSACAHDGRLRVGDRIVIINSQWILCEAHCGFLLSALKEAPAIDITITRNEPLPPPIAIATMSDSELESAVFAHAGLRVRVGPASDTMCWSREQVAAAVKDRFAGPLVLEAAPAAQESPAAQAAPVTAFPASTAASSARADSSGDASDVAAPAKKKKKSVVFAEANPDPFDTYHKEDYERALDPGEGLHHLGELFQKNNQELSTEQEQEVKDSVTNLRLRGFYIERGANDSFGISIAHIPRYTPKSPGLIYSEVVYITEIDPNGAAARDGRLAVGDRVVVLNSQWILCLSHANFLFNALREAPAIDITICRGEPLPPMPQLSAMSDEDLEAGAFEHAGLRVRIGPEWDPVCWSRDQVLTALLPRFASSLEGHTMPPRDSDEEA